MEPSKTTGKREWAYSNTIFAIRLEEGMVYVTVKQKHRFIDLAKMFFPRGHHMVLCLFIIQPYCT